MRYCIPVYGDRIAPRCTIAEALLFVKNGWGKTDEEALVALRDQTWLEVTELMVRHRVGTLVCGGISRESRSALDDLGITVIDNVAATIKSVLKAIDDEELKSGFGLEMDDPVDRVLDATAGNPDPDDRRAKTKNDDEPREARR